jgi:hypothetical protein
MFCFEIAFPKSERAMTVSFEQTLIEVWRQALVENAKVVELNGEQFPIRQTPTRRLRQVNFIFDGKEIKGLERNPETKSRSPQLARSGKKVMQFLSEGRYIANVVDRKMTLYGKRAGTSR